MIASDRRRHLGVAGRQTRRCLGDFLRGLAASGELRRLEHLGVDAGTVAGGAMQRLEPSRDIFRPRAARYRRAAQDDPGFAEAVERGPGPVGLHLIGALAEQIGGLRTLARDDPREDLLRLGAIVRRGGKMTADRFVAGQQPQRARTGARDRQPAGVEDLLGP